MPGGTNCRPEAELREDAAGLLDELVSVAEEINSQVSGDGVVGDLPGNNGFSCAGRELEADMLVLSGGPAALGEHF